jgi:hypothetical protein
VAEVVDTERQLETVPGQPAPPGHPGVVEQYVQVLAEREELCGAALDGRQVGQVERQEGDRLAGFGRDGRRGRLAFFRGPAGQVDPPAPAGEVARGGQADPGIAPGDQERPA